MIPLALIAAQTADALTYLWLPANVESNPLVAALSVAGALAAKACLVVFLLAVGVVLAAKAQRYRGASLRDGLYLMGVLAGAFGAGTNYVHTGGF